MPSTQPTCLAKSILVQRLQMFQKPLLLVAGADIPSDEQRGLIVLPSLVNQALILIQGLF